MTAEQTARKKAYMVEWRKKNRVKTRAHGRKWARKNPDAWARWKREHATTHKATQARYRRNIPPAKRLAKRVRDLYGLTLAQWDTLFALHDGKCHVCLTRAAKVVDHCHSTGRVRGALCHRCNIAIGRLGDDYESFLRITNYLRNP